MKLLMYLYIFAGRDAKDALQLGNINPSSTFLGIPTHNHSVKIIPHHSLVQQLSVEGTPLSCLIKVIIIIIKT